MLNDCIIRCVFVIFGCTYYALSVHVIIFCPILCGVTLTFKLSLAWHQKSFKRKNTILLTCILYSISWLCITIAWPTCNQCQICAQVSVHQFSSVQFILFFIIINTYTINIQHKLEKTVWEYNEMMRRCITRPKAWRTMHHLYKIKIKSSFQIKTKQVSAENSL